MESITTYSSFRQNMKAYFEKVIQDKAPVFISRPGKEKIVIMSESDYDSIQETLYLHSTTTNISRINKSLQRDKSKDKVFTLEELEKNEN